MKKRERKAIRRQLRANAKAWHEWNQLTIAEQISALEAKRSTFVGAFHDEMVHAGRDIHRDINRTASPIRLEKPCKDWKTLHCARTSGPGR